MRDHKDRWSPTTVWRACVLLCLVGIWTEDYEAGSSAPIAVMFAIVFVIFGSAAILTERRSPPS